METITIVAVGESTMQARPKRTIKIFVWKISVSAIYRTIIILLLFVSLVLPWTQMTVSFIPPELKSNAIEGYLQLRVYSIGIIHDETSLKIYDPAGKNATLIYSLSTLSGELFAIFGIFVVVLIILNTLLLISEFKPMQLILRKYKLIELISVVLGLSLIVAYVYVANVLPVGDGNVGVLKINLWNEANDLMAEHRVLRYSFYVGWGFGLVLFFICATCNLIVWVDRHIFIERYNLSNWWRFRGHMILISTLCAILPIAESITPPLKSIGLEGGYYVWSSLFIVAMIIDMEGIRLVQTSLLPPLGVLIAILILAIWTFLSFIISARSLPARYLMSATPYISLTLPDDELARRHKMLPVVSEWYRVVSLKLSLLAFVIAVLIYMFLVHGLGFGQGSIAIEIEGGKGLFRTTLSAWVLVILVLLQALLVFRPTK